MKIYLNHWFGDSSLSFREFLRKENLILKEDASIDLPIETIFSWTKDNDLMIREREGKVLVYLDRKLGGFRQR